VARNHRKALRERERGGIGEWTIPKGRNKVKAKAGKEKERPVYVLHSSPPSLAK
jgi:hypothetical protein